MAECYCRHCCEGRWRRLTASVCSFLLRALYHVAGGTPDCIRLILLMLRAQSLKEVKCCL